jgi:hypothetical protein
VSTALLSWEPIPHRSLRLPRLPTRWVQRVHPGVTGARSYRSWARDRLRAVSGGAQHELRTRTVQPPRARARWTGRSRAQPVAREPAVHSRAKCRTMKPSSSRAVLDNGKSKQPADLLAKIYLAHSQGEVPNAIATEVGLPHSTVDRAITGENLIAELRSVPTRSRCPRATTDQTRARTPPSRLGRLGAPVEPDEAVHSDCGTKELVLSPVYLSTITFPPKAPSAGPIRKVTWSKRGGGRSSPRGRVADTW